MQQNNKVAL